jgi:hypothetical protein
VVLWILVSSCASWNGENREDAEPENGADRTIDEMAQLRLYRTWARISLSGNHAVNSPEGRFGPDVTTVVAGKSDRFNLIVIGAGSGASILRGTILAIRRNFKCIGLMYVRETYPNASAGFVYPESCHEKVHSGDEVAVVREGGF